MSRMPLPPPSPSLSSKAPTLPFSPKKPTPMPVYKDLHFNRDLSATKKLQVTLQLVQYADLTALYPGREYSISLVSSTVMAMQWLQAGVDLVARLVGVTLGPKGRNVVVGNKYGPPKIVNDGETVLKEVLLFMKFSSTCSCNAA